MNNKGVGAVFCFIAALLMIARYMAAAMIMSSMGSWGEELFKTVLDYLGSPLKIASICALIVGIAFIVYSFFENDKKKGE